MARGLRVTVFSAVFAALSLGAASAHSASKTALVLGDSLSAEYGITRGTGWVPLLQKRLQDKRIDVNVVNASISGDTTSGGKARVSALLAKHRPDLVLVELGANDALRGLSLTATEDNLRSIIKSAQAINAKVVLLGMQIPPNYGGDYAQKFSGMFPRLAKETNSVLVPFFLEKIVSTPAMFQDDRLHPTAAAQPLLLDSVWPYLKPIL